MKVSGMWTAVLLFVSASALRCNTTDSESSRCPNSRSCATLFRTSYHDINDKVKKRLMACGDPKDQTELLLRLGWQDNDVPPFPVVEFSPEIHTSLKITLVESGKSTGTTASGGTYVREHHMVNYCFTDNCNDINHVPYGNDKYIEVPSMKEKLDMRTGAVCLSPTPHILYLRHCPGIKCCGVTVGEEEAVAVPDHHCPDRCPIFEPGDRWIRVGPTEVVCHYDNEMNHRQITPCDETTKIPPGEIKENPTYPGQEKVTTTTAATTTTKVPDDVTKVPPKEVPEDVPKVEEAAKTKNEEATTNTTTTAATSTTKVAEDVPIVEAAAKTKNEEATTDTTTTAATSTTKVAEDVPKVEEAAAKTKNEEAKTDTTTTAATSTTKVAKNVPKVEEAVKTKNEEATTVATGAGEMLFKPGDGWWYLLLGTGVSLGVWVEF